MTKWFIASQLFPQPEKNERGFIYWMTLHFDRACTFTTTTKRKDKNTLISLVYRTEKHTQ